jgi:hypothetical protein
MFPRKYILPEVRSIHHFRNYTPDQGPVSIILGGQRIYVGLVHNSREIAETIQSGRDKGSGYPCGVP